MKISSWIYRPVLGGSVALVLAACGGDDGTDAGSGGSTAATGGEGAGASGSGAAGSGGSSSGGGSGTGGGGTDYDLSGPTPTYDPDFIASVGSYGVDPPRFSVWRRLKDAAADNAGCTSVAEGSCALFSCGAAGFVGEPASGGSGLDYIDAGVITASYTQGGTTYSLNLMTDDSDSIFGSPFEPSQGTLVKGDILTYSFAGEDIPAVTVEIPFPGALVTTNAGALQDGDWIVDADRSQDLALTWTGGAPGVLYEVSGGSELYEGLLYCEFESTLGQGTVPTGLLSQLAPATRLGTVTKSARRDTLGGYDVSFATGGGTLAPSGARVFIELY